MLQKIIYTNLLYLALLLTVVDYFMIRALGMANPMTWLLSAAVIISVVLASSVKEVELPFLKS